MPIPTYQSVPVLLQRDKLLDWARALQDYLRQNLQIFAWPDARVTLVNGANNNVSLKGAYIVHITGPTAGFNITGLGGGSVGRQVILHNSTAQVMTLMNQSASSAVGNRITTFGGNVTASVATLVWDKASTSWLLTALR
jgi:hypothetical protein